jgi:dTMP kinase
MLAMQHPERIERIDASGSSDEVGGRIWQTVQARFNLG